LRGSRIHAVQQTSFHLHQLGAHIGHGGVSGLGHLQQLAAAVVRIGFAAHQAPVFQQIDHPHQGRAVQTHALRQGLEADALPAACR
jgi:hypothetical protein